MSRALALWLLPLSIFSCSAPSSNQDKQQLHGDTSLPNASAKTVVADTIPHPSKGFQEFLLGLDVNATYSVKSVHASAQKDFFGLRDISKTFSYLETGILAKTPNACAVISKKNDPGVIMGVEEWSFSSLSEAELVEHALTAPAKDKSEERFVGTPFTFWRIKEKMYYLHTEQVKSRQEMDQLSNMLANSLSGGQ